MVSNKKDKYNHPSHLLEIFSSRMYQLRNENHLTQDEVAEKCGLSREQISNYERAIYAPTLESAVKISDTLNTSIDYLVGHDISQHKDLRYSNQQDVICDEDERKLLINIKEYIEAYLSQIPEKENNDK